VFWYTPLATAIQRYILAEIFLAIKQNVLFKIATEPMVTPKNASGHDEVSIMASTTVRMKTITSTTKLQTTLDVKLLLKLNNIVETKFCLSWQ
jgi:hypothetical protein